MRKLLFISFPVLCLVSTGYYFFQPEKRTNTKEAISAGEREDEKSDLEANENYWLTRSYPDAYVDPKAFDKGMKDAIARLNTERTEDAWTVEGPTNIGGRINCTALDHTNTNIMYVGNASGGVFKTTDGGATWNPIFDAQPYLAIGAITIDPNNHQIIWVGTGDLNISGYPFIGDGIYKSTDGGATWTHMGLTEESIVSKIIVDPTNSNIVYASTMGIPFFTSNDRGLYKSTDGGVNWSQILFVDVDAGIIDMVMDPANSQTLYAASWNRIRNNEVSEVYGPDAHIYKTTNGGATWTMLTGGLPNFPVCRIGLAISQQDHNKLYAVIVDTTLVVQGIYKTTNGGTSWSNVTGNFDNGTFGGQGWYNGRIYVNPANDNYIYVPGVDLQKSLGGGSNWSPATPPWWTYEVHADGHFMDFVDGNTFYYCTDGGMYKTTDNCSTWNDAENIPNTQFYHVTYNPFQAEDYFGGAQDNGTTSGNYTFTDFWNRIYGGDGFKPVFDPLNSDLFYVETQNGGLAYTNDGGFNYYDFTAGIDPSERRSWDMPYLMTEQDHTLFFCGTYRVYKMTGAPNNFWSPISPDLTDGQISEDRFHVITTVSESPLNVNFIYAGTSDGNVWSTTNGSSWNNITSTLPDRYVTAVYASINEEHTVYVTHSGYKDNDFIPHVHKSVNNGTTWTDISGDLPQIAVNDILGVKGDENKLFVATDAGVYYTQNGGTHWNRLGNNMPMMAVYDIEMNPSTNRLIAGTYARGIWSIDVSTITTVDNIVNVKGGNLALYPNPATDVLHVRSITNNKVDVTIFNSDGSIVYFKPQGDGNIELTVPLSLFAQGVYVLNVKDGKNVWSEKFVKMN